MRRSVCLKRLVVFLIIGLWNVKMAQVFLFSLVVLFGFCCIFFRRCVMSSIGKLLWAIFCFLYPSKDSPEVVKLIRWPSLCSSYSQQLPTSPQICPQTLHAESGTSNCLLDVISLKGSINWIYEGCFFFQHPIVLLRKYEIRGSQTCASRDCAAPPPQPRRCRLQCVSRSRGTGTWKWPLRSMLPPNVSYEV